METFFHSPLRTNWFKYSPKYVLLITAICLFCAWLIQYHWKRRRLYKLAAKFDGPLAYPIVGNGLQFLGSFTDAFKIVQQYESPCRIWLGQALIFFVDDPKQIEIAANCLDRHDMYRFMLPLGGYSVVTAPVAVWRRHRKIINPTFNQNVLNGHVSTFVKQANVLIKDIEKDRSDKNFDIGLYVDQYSLDVLLVTALGLPENSQIDSRNVMKLILEGMRVVLKRMFNIMYHFDFFFNRTELCKKEGRLTKTLHKIADDIIEEKIQEYRKMKLDKERNPESYCDDDSIKRHTFLEQLVQLSEEGAEFTPVDIRAQTMTLLVAGSETTSKTISFFIMTLGMFPDIQEGVYKEVMDVLGPEREVDYRDMNKFPFLDRAIKESQRLFPVIPGVVRKVVRDIELENGTIPEGSGICLHVFNLHRNPKIWPDPLKFDPDRFLPEEVAKRHSHSWIPYAAGPRNCIGLKYAVMSMRTVMATLIRRYKFHTAYKNVEDVELSIRGTLIPLNGYKVSVEVREH